MQIERTRAEWKDERERLQAAVADAKLQASQRLTDLTEHSSRQVCPWDPGQLAPVSCSAQLLCDGIATPEGYFALASLVVLNSGEAHGS